MPTRRVVLGAAAAVPLVAACGAEDEPTRGALGDPTTPTPTATPTPGESPTKQPKPEVTALAATADVPVGGALFIDSADVPGDEVKNGVVITQPSAGTFNAFSRDCTHNHCAVADIVDGKIHCPCHDSLYDLATGENVGGPAPAPLTEVPIKVRGKNIVRA